MELKPERARRNGLERTNIFNWIYENINPVWRHRLTQEQIQKEIEKYLEFSDELIRYFAEEAEENPNIRYALLREIHKIMFEKVSFLRRIGPLHQGDSISEEDIEKFKKERGLDGKGE